MAARKSPVFETASTLGRILGFLGISALCGVLAAGLLVPVAAATGVTASQSIEFFDELPSELEVKPLSQPSRVLAKDGTQIASIYAENRKPVELGQVADVMEKAIIAIEDSRFYQHGGVDLQGIMRAAANNLMNDTRQGASTITQQYVNNVLNNARKRSAEDEELLLGDNKDLGDKMREAKLAIAVEKKFSKKEILTGYLNIVFFNANAYGVEAAAQYFYGIPASELNLQQSAMLAGMVRGPSLYNPITNPDVAKQRRNLVLNVMLRQDKITQKEHDKASSADLGLNVTPTQSGCVAANMAPYFCQYVVHEFKTYGAPDAPTKKLKEENPEKAKKMQAKRDEYFAEREEKLRRGGLTIKTTLDPRLQKVAQAEVNKVAPPGENPDKIGSSMVSVQPGTGKILSMAQNTKIVAKKDAWSNVYNFNVDANMGGTGGYQVGSAYKPYTLAAWLADGRSLGDVVDASQRVYERDFPWKASCAPDDYTAFGYYDPNDPYEPTSKLDNFSDGYYHKMSVLDGIVQSINTATIASAAELDLCSISDIANDTGLHDGRTQEDISNLKISSLIGGSSQSISPLSMAASFATFSSGGTYCKPYAIASITDRNGKKLDIPGQDCERAVKKKVAQGVNYALQEVIERGSGYYLDPEVPAGLKTGTTDDSVQTWTVGYTSGISTAAWVGNPDKYRSLDGLEFLGDGTTHDYVDGATYAGEAWQSFTEQVADLYSTEEFPEPPEELIEKQEEQEISPDDSEVVESDESSDDTSDASALAPAPGTPTVPDPPAAAQAPAAPPAGSTAPPAGGSTSPPPADGSTTPPPTDSSDGSGSSGNGSDGSANESGSSGSSGQGANSGSGGPGNSDQAPPGRDENGGGN
ncbi:transglycosylase domain-containing protein [Arthrobacter castelli]|uniref:transglycosylase domain-containing protein n=1 Tax=Arthrobacter castelli TaxID=271431 RepID=UPI0006865AF3|nr:transglycosylase domain-containing protein [Arthrobacter castelli]